MTRRRSADPTPLQALCALVERGLPGDDAWSLERPWRDGWCLLRGPTCCFFVGEAEDPGGRAWITFGPAARKTEVTGDRRQMRDEFTYRFREADRRPLDETPLAEAPPDAGDAAGFLEELHGRVVDDLGRDALLWDGWVVWGWGTDTPWPTVPGLAGPG